MCCDFRKHKRLNATKYCSGRYIQIVTGYYHYGIHFMSKRQCIFNVDSGDHGNKETSFGIRILTLSCQLTYYAKLRPLAVCMHKEGSTLCKV